MITPRLERVAPVTADDQGSIARTLTPRIRWSYGTHRRGRLSSVWAMGRFGRKSTDEDPAHGYGRGKRPLWTVRDRDAEAIRDVLREAKRAEFSDAGGGFVVGGQDGASFLVACADEDLAAACEVAAYTEALTAAGFRVEPEPRDDQTLRVWITTP